MSDSDSPKPTDVDASGSAICSTDSVWLAADFSRTPKTDVFCHCCQKDLPVTAAMVWIADDMQRVVPAGHVDAAGMVHIGRQCAKNAGIPSEWIIQLIVILLFLFSCEF